MPYLVLVRGVALMVQFELPCKIVFLSRIGLGDSDVGFYPILRCPRGMYNSFQVYDLGLFV